DGGWRFMLDDASGIAYVRLTEFLPNAPAQLDDAMRTALNNGARALILDLRENRGGLLDAAIDVADRFLAGGVIVSTRGLHGPSSDPREWRARGEGAYPNISMAVLVNAWSASSAEIVAGALRDHRRAVLVGERTYGKGSVQELIPLRNDCAVKLTTRHYYLPGGACIQKPRHADADHPDWGVMPNVVVPLTPGQRERWLKQWLDATWNHIEPSSTQEVETEEQVAAFLEALLDADPQFKRAVELLRTRTDQDGANISNGNEPPPENAQPVESDPGRVTSP
ncbi:MAG: S41 family peptidase, partial [Phycisphaerae bacterium]